MEDPPAGTETAPAPPTIHKRSSIQEGDHLIDTSHDPEDIDEQLELFLIKYPDTGRPLISSMRDDFKKQLPADEKDVGVLDEAQSMRLFESRANTKTFVELRHLFEEVDINKDRKISFLEWCTVHFDASWAFLHENITEASVQAAQAKLDTVLREREERESAESAAKVKEAEEIEAESHLEGVASKNAMFERKAKSPGLSNEEKIKAESALRRKQKEAEKELAAAAEGSMEDKIKREKEKAEETARLEKEEEDKATAEKRAAFKAKQEAMFGGKK